MYNDPPAPSSPPGATDELWEYEVVELFLMGSEQRYLEVEVCSFVSHTHDFLTQGRRGTSQVHRSTAKGKRQPHVQTAGSGGLISSRALTMR